MYQKTSKREVGGRDSRFGQGKLPLFIFDGLMNLFFSFAV
jgi:hypothetical protein